jgi:hypothetical protein
MPPTHPIPARHGTATILRAHQHLKLTTPHNPRAISTWALALPSPSLNTPSSRLEAPLYPAATSTISPSPYSAPANRAAAAPEYMSMSHCRVSLLKLTPTVGDTLVSQKRAPLLKMTEDTSPGVHDTLIAACDRWRYAELGVTTYHENCTDNFWDALAALADSLGDSEEGEVLEGLQMRMGGRVPDPFTLFMDVRVKGEGARWGVCFEEPVGGKGGFVVFEALRDVVVVMSVCPQNGVGGNGEGLVEACFEVW